MNEKIRIFCSCDGKVAEWYRERDADTRKEAQEEEKDVDAVATASPSLMKPTTPSDDQEDAAAAAAADAAAGDAAVASSEKETALVCGHTPVPWLSSSSKVLCIVPYCVYFFITVENMQTIFLSYCM